VPRHAGLVVAGIAAVVALFIAAAGTVASGWVLSLLGLPATRWQDAYVALEAAETNLPRNERERERLLLMQAQVDDPAQRAHRALAFAGRHLDCDDSGLRAPQDGEITTCVPRALGVEAHVVPDPRLGCMADARR